MDCGIPFCYGAGCPLKNPIPDMNIAALENRWEDAMQLLADDVSLSGDHRAHLPGAVRGRLLQRGGQRRRWPSARSSGRSPTAPLRAAA